MHFVRQLKQLDDMSQDPCTLKADDFRCSPPNVVQAEELNASNPLAAVGVLSLDSGLALMPRPQQKSPNSKP